jgi:hypothetical protein
MQPVFYPAHFFEGSTVTVTGEATGFSKDHLSDRDIVTVYQDSGTAGTRILMAQWTNTEPRPSVDTWIIPAQHGLVGTTLSLESSVNGTTWTVRDTYVPTTTAVIRRVIPGGPHAAGWWRLTLTGAIGAPYLAELFLTRAVTLPRSTNYETRDGLVSEVARFVTPGGSVRKSRRWGPRWFAQYTIAAITLADWDVLMAAVFPIIDARCFYLTDMYGTLRYAELLDSRWEGALMPIERRTVSLALQAAA